MQDAYLNSPVFLDRSLIEQLLPHRDPFLFLDSVISFESDPQPALEAEYYVEPYQYMFSKNESSENWPSMYVIEGLGQCANLLAILSVITRMLKSRDQTSNDPNTSSHRSEKDLKAFINENSLRISGDIANNTMTRIGLLGAVNMEVTGYVRKAQTLRYKVQQTQVYNALSHFKADAFVEQSLIAEGVLIGSTDLRISTNREIINIQKGSSNK